MAIIPQVLRLQGVYLRDVVTMENIFEIIPENSKSNNDILYNSNNSYEEYMLNSYENNNNNDNNDNEYIKYDKIPKIFKNLDEWPKRINIKCLYCTLNILKIPIPVPSTVEITKDTNYIFDIYAVCCSFPCAARLVTEHTNNSSLRFTKLQLLKLIKKIFHNELTKPESLNQQFGIKTKDKYSFIKILNTDIPLAPKREKLCQYGGNMSIKEFKHKLYKLEYNISKNE